jgi:rare lipoprotein A
MLRAALLSKVFVQRLCLFWLLACMLTLIGCASVSAPTAPSTASPPSAPTKPAASKAVVPTAPVAAPTPFVLPATEPISTDSSSLNPSPAEAHTSVNVREQTSGWTESGIASWYGPRFQGKRTANGERFDTNELTAAHKTLPFGTRVRVKSLVNGKEVTVRINDRGPFIKGRIIDLSKAAAQAIGLSGVKQVEIFRLK